MKWSIGKRIPENVDLQGLAMEVSTIAYWLRQHIDGLKTDYPYSWARAVETYGALMQLMEQLRDDDMADKHLS